MNFTVVQDTSFTVQNTRPVDEYRGMLYPTIHQSPDSDISVGAESSHFSPIRRPMRHRHSSISINTRPTSPPFTPATPPPSYASVNYQSLGASSFQDTRAWSPDTSYATIPSNISELPTPANDTSETPLSRSLSEEHDVQPTGTITRFLSLQNESGRDVAKPPSTKFSLRFRRRSGLGPIG